jgi:hypothetical protein
MYAIEFKADISNGVIEIPPQYRDKMQTHVKVILLSDEATNDTHDIIDDLLASPIKISEFKPLNRDEIYTYSGNGSKKAASSTSNIPFNCPD